MRALKLLFGAATALGVTALALVAFTPFDGCVLPDFTLADAGAVDAGVDASLPCGVGTGYPGPPGGQDTGADVGPIVVAVHTISLGDDANTPVPGYDLDRVCTCIDDGGVSCTGRSPVMSTYCDAVGGVDDQTLRLVMLIQNGVGQGTFGSDFFTAGAETGKWSLLIEVTGYSGMPDDPVVQVALFPSPGLVPNDAGAPLWNGTDAWQISSTSVVPGDAGPGDGGQGDAGLVPAFQALGAYVSSGVLVASIPTSVLVFSGGTGSYFQLHLSGGVLTGKLKSVSTPLGVQWELADGVLAARWSLADLFSDIASYRDPAVAPFCTSSPIYQIAKESICNDADIHVDDSEPPSTPCDAISFGLGFTADPAKIGPVEDAGPPVDGCPAGTSPAGDVCPPP